MKITKNSLLVRMVFYNNIAIIITTATIALILTFVAFNNIESKVIETTQDKIELLSRSYNSENLKTKDELNQIIKNIFVLSDKTTIEELTYSERMKIVHEQLKSKDIKLYKNSSMVLLDNNGNIIGEDGAKNLPLKEDKKEIKKVFFDVLKKNKSIFFTENDGKIYSRIILKYYDRDINDFYVIFTQLLTVDEIVKIGELIGLRESDRIFLTVDEKTRFKHKTKEINSIGLDEKSRLEVFKEYTKYTYKKKIIDGKKHYVIYYDLNDYNNNYIGSIGLGIYYEDIESLKVIITTILIVIVLMFIIISTSVSTRLFTKLLSPLSNIVEATQEISKGNYKVYLNPEGVDEIRILSRNLNKMAEDIQATHSRKEDEREKLTRTLNRIEAIEKILMNIQIEDDVNITIKELLCAMTSEMGLGYSRAMYFRYSREIDAMLGELSVVNKKVKKDILLSSVTDNKKAFDFQVEKLEKLMKLIRVPFNSENLLTKSLKEKKIIYFNDKGYKYELGNELFRSFGISNFLILPIYSKNRNYGCIVLDYIGTNKRISPEEVELLTLLFMNISIRIKNKNLEEEKIDFEKTATIGKLVDRFFRSRENSFEKMLEFMEKVSEYDGNSLFKIQAQELKNEISKLKREREILNEYVDVKEKRELEILEIEKIISEVIADEEKKLEEMGISISMLVNSECKILGDKKRLKRVFYELIKNSKQSFENKKDKNNKKINIIVTKEKNIDKIKIDIIDNGIGITKDELENIFEPFVGYNKNLPGLGLAITSRIIKDHNGVIKIYSNFGEGTDVKITLNIYKEDN